MINLFKYIDKIINEYIEFEYKDKIKKIFEEISDLITVQKRGFLKISELNTNEFCINILRQCTLKYMYEYFIINIIPSISFYIYNKKIEKYLTKMEKRYNNKSRNVP